MIKLQIWNKESNLVLPNGAVMTPSDILRNDNYRWTMQDDITVVVEYLPDESGRIGALDSLGILKETYQDQINFDALSDEEAVAEIEYLRNNPPPPNPDLAPLSRSDVQKLEQHITELMLMQMEG